MTKMTRFLLVSVTVVFLACATGFAQNSGEAVYKSKCAGCHGAAGLADSGVGKVLKVKPVTAPEVFKMPRLPMIDAVKNGMGKMQPFKNSLTDDQIKASVDYFRTFLK